MGASIATLITEDNHHEHEHEVAAQVQVLVQLPHKHLGKKASTVNLSKGLSGL